MRIALVGIGWLIIWLVMPLIRMGIAWLGHVLWCVVVRLLLFWLLTGLLPPVWGQRLRRAAWWVLRFTVRLLANLVR